MAKASTKKKKAKRAHVTLAFQASGLDTMFKVSDRLERMSEDKFNGECLGAGCGFGERDMNFTFKSKKDAQNFKKAAKKIRGIKFTEFKIK